MVTTEDLLRVKRKEMSDYLITVTRKQDSAYASYDLIQEIRLIQVSEEYVEAFMDGVKAVYPTYNVYKNEVK